MLILDSERERRLARCMAGRGCDWMSIGNGAVNCTYWTLTRNRTREPDRCVDLKECPRETGFEPGRPQ